MHRELILCLFIIGVTGCQDKVVATQSGIPPNALGSLRTVQFEINGTPVETEVALTSQEQTQGLMYRESMPENHGMLFVSTEPRYQRFWMKNTKIPLSIAYIREDGVISDILDMQPHHGPFDPVESFQSTQKCLYALEMNQGWFDKHNIKAGDKLPLPYEQIEKLKQDLNQKNS